MDLFQGVNFQIKFNWKFWEPIDCIGGKVYFGRYVEYDPKQLEE
jgi:hypothetical protein